jgi:hypothetical protein
MPRHFAAIGCFIVYIAVFGALTPYSLAGGDQRFGELSATVKAETSLVNVGNYLPDYIVP